MHRTSARGARAWLVVALALIGSAACTQDLTELVVVVESDLGVPHEIDRVVVAVDATALGGQMHTREAALAGRDALPVTLSLVHSGGGALGPVHVRATAYLGGLAVVERRADVSFVSSQTRAVVLALSRTCFGVVCSADQTCSDGACRPIAIDPGELDPPGTDGGPGGCSCARPRAMTTCADGVCSLTGCEPLFADCDGLPDNGCEVPIDTATDCGGCGVPCSLAQAAESCGGGTCAIASCETGFGDCDRMPANGCERSLTTTMDCGGCGTRCTRAHATATCATGTCRIAVCDDRHSNPDGIDENGCEFMGCDATRCACMETCSDSGACACTSGCPCTFGCEDDCRASCSGAAARCTIDARDISNLRLDCSDGAICTVDARDASNAQEVRCETGAACEIDCDHASNCAIECRSGATCSVRCGRRADNCRFSACEGGEMSCPGDVIVCNRPCP